MPVSYRRKINKAQLQALPMVPSRTTMQETRAVGIPENPSSQASSTWGKQDWKEPSSQKPNGKEEGPLGFG